MATEATAQPPVPFLKLKDIAHQACDTTLSTVTSYDHTLAESWNSEIINSTLSALIKATTPSGAIQPPYKYSITSTIIQHLPLPSLSSKKDTAATSSATSAAPRRGMHAAAGAFWDNTKDGMWSYKYEAADKKGLDVVVAVIWIWVGYPPNNVAGVGGGEVGGK